MQCKNTVDSISLTVVETEIRNAEVFEPVLDHLYIATTAKRDAVLQKNIRDISQLRRKASKFKVSILFWDDVCQDLAKDDRVFFAHYPQFRNGFDHVKEHDKTLFEALMNLLSSGNCSP